MEFVQHKEYRWVVGIDFIPFFFIFSLLEHLPPIRLQETSPRIQITFLIPPTVTVEAYLLHLHLLPHHLLLPHRLVPLPDLIAEAVQAEVAGVAGQVAVLDPGHRRVADRRVAPRSQTMIEEEDIPKMQQRIIK